MAVYTDAGISGAKGRADRPGLDAMLNAAIKGGFDVVMAWSVDRLGRSLIDLLGTIQHLEACGIDLYLDQQSIDTTTPTGPLMFQICEAFAEFERSIIRQRITADDTQKTCLVLLKRLQPPFVPRLNHTSISPENRPRRKPARPRNLPKVTRAAATAAHSLSREAWGATVCSPVTLQSGDLLCGQRLSLGKMHRDPTTALLGTKTCPFSRYCQAVSDLLLLPSKSTGSAPSVAFL